MTEQTKSSTKNTIFDIVAVVGNYTDNRTGDEKLKYHTVGSGYIKPDGKQGMFLTTPVVFHEDGSVVKHFSWFERKPKAA